MDILIDESTLVRLVVDSFILEQLRDTLPVDVEECVEGVEEFEADIQERLDLGEEDEMEILFGPIKEDENE